jgi:CHAT domain-containing protein/tetratricopeptide (TPR) repeat protein
MVTLEQIPELETLSDQAWRALEVAENSSEPGATDRAVSRCTALLRHPAISEAPTQIRLMALGLASSAYSARYESRGDPADLDEIIRLNRQILRRAPPDWENLGLHLTQLGNACSNRFKVTREAEDLKTSIDAYRRAVKEAGTDPEQLVGRLTNLGIGFKERYDRTHDPKDLEEAVEVLERAVAMTPEESPDLAMFLMNLGCGLRARAVAKRAQFDHQGADTDLDAAIETYQRAKALANAPPALESNLAGVLLERSGLPAGPADLDTLIESSQCVAETTPEGEEVPHEQLFNLAGLLVRRHHEQRNIEDLVAASDAYRTSFQGALNRDFRHAIEAAKGWGDTAAALHSWDEAAEAYRCALDAGDGLFREQRHFDDGEDILSTLRGLAPAGAYALARAGELEDAVVTLERGRALLLDPVLERKRADLEELNPELQQRYRMAKEISSLARAVGAELVAPTAEKELQAVLTEIRKLDGYEHFLKPPGFEEIASVATTGPLVYLLAADSGGLALIVGTDRTVTPIWLPEMMAGFLEVDCQIFQAAYYHRDEEPEKWLERIDTTTHRLWEIAMGPVAEVLDQASRITLIPTGLLSLLPLHAAWTDDPSMPSGRRYLIDDLLITYSPSARALATGQLGSTDPPADSVLMVADPRPAKTPPLRYAGLEIELVSRSFSRKMRTLSGEAATRSAVARALKKAARGFSVYRTPCPVLHFCCHGTADVAEPLHSGLLLAGDELLSLQDLIQIRLPSARLAVLSACETAMVGEDLPDEVLGLPSGLLQAGVNGIIGSLWAVWDEISTPLLLGRFYEFWLLDGLDPAEALRQAQLWVRDAKNDEIGECFPEILEVLGLARPERKAVRDVWQASPKPDPMRAHPAAWAPFVFVGR